MLRLVEERPGLWDRFQQDPSAHSFAVARHDPASVVPRWERARSLGLSPLGPSHPLGVSDCDLAVRRDEAIGSLRAGTAIVEALEDEVSARGFVTLVTDAAGVIVRARGGEALSLEIRRSRLVEGASWDEGSRGTNAIGTAIAEGRAVAVVGRAHFESVNHGLFCYATPIRDPFGELVAVLDVTGPVTHDHAAIGAAVRSAAAAMEETLRNEAYAATGGGTRRLIERMIDRTSTAALLLEPPGVVRRMNDAASLELDLDGPTTVEHLFGVSWKELTRAAALGSSVFETRRRKFDVDFEPVVDSRGRTLGIVCFLTPSAPRVRAPRPSRLPHSGPGSTLRNATSLSLPNAFDAIIGTDPALVSAKQSAARIATSDLPVLLLAETGTGKELFARAVHGSSARATRSFVAVNCGALTGSLLESELFGYAPGAFTGATRSGAEGKLAAAHGGTLFLDEVAEMPASVQAMLLRFLEDGAYYRVGDSTPRRADVRVVTATCRDLPALVAEGTFRSDLAYRIHGGSIRIPPLRERADRLELARALVAERATASGIAHAPELSPTAEAWILEHAWPGNVRELKSAIHHAVAMASGRELSADDFPEPLVATVPGDDVSVDGPRARALKEMARVALEKAHGNVSEAARRLGVARSTLYRMLGGPRGR